MRCLIYMHSPLGAARPRALCIYIRQRTLACVITYTYIYIYIYIYKAKLTNMKVSDQYILIKLAK